MGMNPIFSIAICVGIAAIASAIANVRASDVKAVSQSAVTRKKEKNDTVVTQQAQEHHDTVVEDDISSETDSMEMNGGLPQYSEDDNKAAALQVDVGGDNDDSKPVQSNNAVGDAAANAFDLLR